MTTPKTPSSQVMMPNHDLDKLSKYALKSQIAKLRKKYGVPQQVVIKKDAFESLGDLEAFITNYNSADVHSGKPTAITSRQTRITGANIATSRSAITAELNKKKKGRDAKRTWRSAPSVPQNKSTQTSSRRASAKKADSSMPISSLMKPGVYNGEPWRILGRKDLPREIDVSVVKFRRQKRGIGKCTGNRLKRVMSALSNAYYFAESARQEVSLIRQSPDAMLLWHAYLKHKEASLAYWFGADYSPAQTNRMLNKIEGILSQWSLAFCAGFRGLLPVWIRCKSKNGVGKGPARHLVANTIELFPRFFDMSQNRRSITMLHEMGHRSSSLLKPRDERHNLCTGGWNKAKNMCYRDPGDVDKAQNNYIFQAGNPRELAIAATNGNVSARKTALNNIDSYVCYMWNRHQDHKTNILYLLPPGTKAPRLPPRDTTAPSR